jgi:hypothetical protein
MGSSRSRLARTLALIVVSSLPAFGASAAQDASTTYSPQEMVRRMVASEISAQEHDHTKWHFFSKRQEDGKVVVQEKVQTVAGTLRRIVMLNGKPLSADELKQQSQKLEEFTHDPAAQEKRRRDERADAEKAKKMFEMFPRAFIYTHAGEENGLVKLHFVPNPNFDPPTREAQVFHAMSGMLWIEPKQMRFAKMQASLMDDVKFGWGLLGHLDRGGTMLIEQKEVGPEHWEIVHMDIDLKGKAVLFKSISVQQKEENYGFERLPDTIDMNTALAMLQKPEPNIARMGGK